VKPPRFAYAVPESLDETVGLLGAQGDDAALLAGGQSLVPMLNFRFGAPGLIIDINRVAGIDGVAVEGSELRIGALVRHTQLIRSPIVQERCSLLQTAARSIGHPAIRNRGTIGGSLAHADPAAELPAVVAALGGRVELTSREGRREVAYAEFALGPMMTSKRPDEMLTSVILPVLGSRVFGFHEIARRSGDFAHAGAVAVLDIEGRVVREAWLGLFGVEAVPRRLMLVEAALAGAELARVAELALAALHGEALDLQDAPGLPAAYRGHLASVALTNALAAAVSEVHA
jgi:carbon-monoxide dehydrogenase medium subunit